MDVFVAEGPASKATADGLQPLSLPVLTGPDIIHAGEAVA